MTAIKDWSTTASSNNASDLFPEGMPPGNVNDNLRGVLAALRTQYEAGGWVQLHDDGTNSHTVTYDSATSFIASGDRSAIYAAGRRVKWLNGTTGDTGYGTIESNSVSTNTTVTVEQDSSIPIRNETLTVWVGSDLQLASTPPVIAVPTTKTSGYTVTAADHMRTIPINGAVTVTLPDVADVSDGFWVRIFNADSDTVTIIDDASSGDLINGVAEIKMEGKYEFVVLQSTGSTWYVVDDGRTMIVRAYGSQATTLNDGVSATIDLDSFINDYTATTPWGFSLATNQLSVPEPGMYELHGSVFVSGMNDQSLIQTAIRLNGSAFAQSQVRQSVNGTGVACPCIGRAVVTDPSSDYFDLRGTLNGESDSSSTNSLLTYLECKRL